MLILARYPQEAILIGEVRVTVLNIIRRKHGRPRVTLGIDAPAAIPILRAELLQRRPHKKNGPPTSCLEVNPHAHEQAATLEKQEEAGTS